MKNSEELLVVGNARSLQLKTANNVSGTLAITNFGYKIAFGPFRTVSDRFRTVSDQKILQFLFVSGHGGAKKYSIFCSCQITARKNIPIFCSCQVTARPKNTPDVRATWPVAVPGGVRGGPWAPLGPSLCRFVNVVVCVGREPRNVNRRLGLTRCLRVA